MTTNTTRSTINQIHSSHIDLSARYGCRAFMTVVTFMFSGVAHRARKFFRADLATAGGTLQANNGLIELYTLEPFAGEYTTCTELGWYESAQSEDWLGYAAEIPTSRRDRLATMLIAAAYCGDVFGDDQSLRFSLIEAA